MRFCLGKIGTHFLVVLILKIIGKLILSSLADKFIPKVKIMHMLTSVPWWFTALSKAVEKKHLYIMGIYLCSMSSHDFQIYAKQRNLKIRSVQRNYEEHLINKFSRY